MAADKDNFLAPGKVSQQAKSAATDQMARMIVSQEAAAREKKTARLKALRMQQEPVADEPTASEKKKSKKR
jgi:hypothetical protein